MLRRRRGSPYDISPLRALKLVRSMNPYQMNRGRSWAVGCVSYLNSKPLIEPLLRHPAVHVHFVVPAALLELMTRGTVAAALMPIVDYQNSPIAPVLVPAGAICSDGPTLTVRIFSRVAPRQITRLHADTDSHTSVILAQVILRELYGCKPRIIPLEARSTRARRETPETLLLIGDKVVNAAPPAKDYPWQLDLGAEWKRLTGLPFVFAMWMMPTAAPDMELARLLAEARRDGGRMTDQLVERYAGEKGWPADLARRYFTEHIRYEVTPRCRKGVETFFQLSDQHGLLAIHRPVHYLEIQP